MSKVPRALTTQPLPYFLALGVGLFALQSAFGEDATTIRIDDAVSANVSAQLTTELGRPPNAAEMERRIEQWKEDEALYREGLALGLVESDETVRSLIASRMRLIGVEGSAVTEPTDAEMKRYLEQNAAAFRTPLAYDVDHVFIARAQADGQDAERRASLALARLNAGDSPSGVGDHFPRGPSFSGESSASLERALGVELGRQLESAPLGIWQSFNGKRGVHLLRVTQRTGGATSFEQLRPALRLAVQAQAKELRVRQFVEQIKARYRFVSEASD